MLDTRKEQVRIRMKESYDGLVKGNDYFVEVEKALELQDEGVADIKDTIKNKHVS